MWRICEDLCVRSLATDLFEGPLYDCICFDFISTSNMVKCNGNRIAKNEQTSHHQVSGHLPGLYYITRAPGPNLELEVDNRWM